MPGARLSRLGDNQAPRTTVLSWYRHSWPVQLSYLYNAGTACLGTPYNGTRGRPISAPIEILIVQFLAGEAFDPKIRDDALHVVNQTCGNHVQLDIFGRSAVVPAQTAR